MAIGLTARQKADLAAMLPHIEESVGALKRLIADTKDRTRALQKLSDAEEAQRRHASEVGIPFNADAFARRRAELDALPKTLTVEEGQLSAFSQLQRSIGIVLDGPYERAGRGGAQVAKKSGRASGKAPAKSAKKQAGKAKPGATKAGAKSSAKPAARKDRPAARKAQPVARPATKRPAMPAPKVPLARVPFQKPLPLALGS